MPQKQTCNKTQFSSDLVHHLIQFKLNELITFSHLIV